MITVGNSFWSYQIWLYVNPTNVSILILLVTAIITLSIARSNSLSAKATNNMLKEETKPFIAWSGYADYEQYVVQIENIAYYREHLFFTNYGKGAALLRDRSINHPDLKADIGVPITLGNGASTNITIYLPNDNEIYETILELYYWDITGACYCTIIKFKINHTRKRGDMLRIISEEVKEIGKKEMPSKINNWL